MICYHCGTTDSGSSHWAVTLSPDTCDSVHFKQARHLRSDRPAGLHADEESNKNDCVHSASLDYEEGAVFTTGPMASQNGCEVMADNPDGSSASQF